MKRIVFLCYLISILSCTEKETYSFQVQEGSSLLTPVAVNLKMTGFNAKDLALYHGDTRLTFQVDRASEKLWFLHHPDRSEDYVLQQAKDTTKKKGKLKAEKQNGNMVLSINDIPFIQYRHEMTYPPKGVDSIFAKSGYIHPIITPGGDTLTRIQPPDHFHHYGLWGPWTHTLVNGERVDFWNLGEGMGTVLFKEFKNTNSGSVFSSFTASQEHIDFKTTEDPQVALNEDLKLTLWNLEDPTRYMFDYTSSFSSPLKEGILFEAYRYGGGLGLRFNERWKADNCSVLTSEGKDRLTADGSNAKWCIVTGEASKGGTNGILFMSHPENRMHPEPMRVWPIDANDGRGDMFFEFCPIRHEQWKIEPAKNYELKYRMLVFDGEINAEEAEAYWQAFANQPTTSPSNN